MSQPAPPSDSQKESRPPRPPIQWSGVLFAFAANVLVVNLVQMVVIRLGLNATWEALATLAGPVLVGAATAFYTRKRGGIHAFLGGMASIVVLGLGAFEGNWQFAILAGSFCAFGGIAAELFLRTRTSDATRTHSK